METVEEAKIISKTLGNLDLNQKFISKPTTSDPFAKSPFLDSNQKSSLKHTSVSSGKSLFLFLVLLKLSVKLQLEEIIGFSFFQSKLITFS